MHLDTHKNASVQKPGCLQVPTTGVSIDAFRATCWWPPISARGSVSKRLTYHSHKCNVSHQSSPLRSKSSSSICLRHRQMLPKKASVLISFPFHLSKMQIAVAISSKRKHDFTKKCVPKTWPFPALPFFVPAKKSTGPVKLHFCLPFKKPSTFEPST